MLPTVARHGTRHGTIIWGYYPLQHRETGSFLSRKDLRSLVEFSDPWSRQTRVEETTYNYRLIVPSLTL